LTAILDWGFVGKQVRPSIIALVASVSIVIVASVGWEGPSRDEVAVSDEATVPDEELVEPEWLTTSEEARDVPKFGNDASLFGCCVRELPWLDAELEAVALENQMLLDSLSPGVRARWRAWLRDRADALEKKWERKAAERERDEAEYAAFIEEHLRRLSEEQPSRRQPTLL